MYIRKLIIQETHPTKKIIRSIPFTLGLNLIVDDSKHSGNNVGKTTVLRIIDICLGEKEKSSIYTDQETNLVNIPLRDYIQKQKVEAILELSTNLDNLNNHDLEANFYLSVGLFNYGKRKINNQLYNLDDTYYTELNKILFDYTESFPQYLDIIKKFARVEIDGGATKILRFSPNRMQSNLTYRILYNFLFNLLSIEKNNQLANNRLLSKKTEENITTFNKFLGKKSINNLKHEIYNQNTVIMNLTKQIKSDATDDNFIYKIEELTKLQTDIALLNQDIGTTKFHIKMHKQNLEYSFQSNKDISTEVLENLYNETQELTVNLEKTFNDLINFNESLVKNKINYYTYVLENKHGELTEKLQLKKDLNKKYKKLSSSIDKLNFDKTSVLYEELIHEKAKLLELESFQTEFDELNVAKQDILNEFADLELNLNFHPDQADNNIATFNMFYQKNTKKALGIEYKLGYSPDLNNFPLNLLTSDESISIGLKKGLISIFDLSYLQFAKKIEKKVPHFILYDVIETIESRILNNIFDLVKAIDCQYIVAVLNEKINEINNVSDEDKILILSKENKLFKI